jgi:hypothetical protein
VRWPRSIRHVEAHVEVHVEALPLAVAVVALRVRSRHVEGSDAGGGTVADGALGREALDAGAVASGASIKPRRRSKILVFLIAA